jgi:hypothetical protein
MDFILIATEFRQFKSLNLNKKPTLFLGQSIDLTKLSALFTKLK